MLTLWATANTLEFMVIYVVIGGFCAHGFIAIYSVVIASLFGPKKTSMMNGLIYSGMALGILGGSPVGGWLVDHAPGDKSNPEKYFGAIYYGGASMALASLIVLWLRLLVCRSLWAKL
jgi:MFS family permease